MGERCSRAALVILVGLWFVGCASSAVELKATRLGVSPPASASGANRNVELYRQGERGPESYEVLGVVTGVSSGPRPDEKPIIDTLKGEAAAMGADALVGYYSNTGVRPGKGWANRNAFENVVWSSALAVRVLSSEQPPAKRGADVVVFIPRAAFGKEEYSESVAGKLDQLARKQAQLYLAEKGYYALLANEWRAGAGDADASEAAPRTVDGLPVTRVLDLRFVGGSWFTLLVMTSESVALDGTLYRRDADQKRVEWRGSGSGSGTLGWILNLVVPDAKREMALQGALRAMFQSLPDMPARAQ